MKNIKITFPVRGHAYLECDKNVGLWKLKEKMETPKDFKNMIKNSRIKPSPFVVVSVSKQIVYNWTQLLSTTYNVKKSLPHPTNLDNSNGETRIMDLCLLTILT